MGKKEEFNWLDDPFDEKKTMRDRQRMSSRGSVKLAFGCFFVVALISVIVIIFFALNVIALFNS